MSGSFIYLQPLTHFHFIMKTNLYVYDNSEINNNKKSFIPPFLIFPDNKTGVTITYTFK